MSLKVAKRRSIVPHSTKKAGKKFLTSCPFFVAIRMAATLFQLIVDTVLCIATLAAIFFYFSIIGETPKTRFKPLQSYD